MGRAGGVTRPIVVVHQDASILLVPGFDVRPSGRDAASYWLAAASPRSTCMRLGGGGEAGGGGVLQVAAVAPRALTSREDKMAADKEGSLPARGDKGSDRGSKSGSDALCKAGASGRYQSTAEKPGVLRSYQSTPEEPGVLRASKGILRASSWRGFTNTCNLIIKEIFLEPNQKDK